MENKNYRSLSKRYRETGKGNLSQEQVVAYVAGRMPATKAAISFVLKEVKLRYFGKVERIIDLGAGTGAGVIAAREVFSYFSETLLVESNPHMRREGKKFVDGQWVNQDLLKYSPPKTDCIVFGYSYGELEEEKRLLLLQKVYKSANLIVIVEPGTPRGYANVLEARNFLLSCGGKMVAPCPHENSCPMKKEDWCHFSVRLSRTKQHRQFKGAQRGYEDEKFSYVAISKKKGGLAEGRILRHPIKKKGHIKLQICQEEGIFETTVSKKLGDRYQKARKLCWAGGVSSHFLKPH